MEVFFKSQSQVFYMSHQKLDTNKIKFDRTQIYNLGIDGSTTSFGISWYNSDFSCVNTMMLMRSTYETGITFMEEVFPFLKLLFNQVKFSICTYEKTPDDFTKDTEMVRIMKRTEKSVRLFLENASYLDIIDRDYIFDIFPNSWKSYCVPKDLIFNVSKVNKRENAKSILEHCNLDSDYWLKELDILKGHMYDGIEALGIGVYGSEFIFKEPMIRTYRNFTRRKPLFLIGILVTEDNLNSRILEIMGILKNIKITMYIPNEYHSAFENLHALDSDKKVGLLITEHSCEVRSYLEHIHGLFTRDKNMVLLAFTLRVNKETIKLSEIFAEKSYAILAM